MILAVATVAGLASWDADREDARALADFAAEQATLARALGAVLQVAAKGGIAGPALAAEVQGVPRPDGTIVLVRRGGERLFSGPGGPVDCPPVDAAFVRGAGETRLSRAEAAAVGLPARTALAGLARVRTAAGDWQVAAVATAQRERDRERAAARRLIGSVAVAAVLVFAFGGIAMREQRKELVLERELAVAELQHSADERLQRASRMAALGTLAIGVAHEIATPLGVIAGRAEQLMPRATDERTRRGLDAIQAQVRRIDEVVRGLLGLARGDLPAGQRVAPGEAAEAAVALVEHRFAKAGVPLAQQIAPGLPPVSGDARLIEHALVNLLLNACDACRDGGSVTVRAEPAPGEVVFTVADTGAGISAADLSRVTEPLFTTKPSGEGTGLGLAIAREIASSHRGSLAVARGEAGGTVVTVRLPVSTEVAPHG
ncbi:MAG TPA: HAMP domain-containing sensor histidine kinase [Polyangia bacterium]|nr:HAMP domain-containing sensor histidine kinase [Polyangia bacterium]